MLQAVEQRIDQGFFLEQLVPVGQIEIGRDDGRDAAVTLVHETEEGVGLFRLEGQVAEFVDEQNLQTAQAFEQPRGGAIGERCVEFVEQRLGVVEAAAVTVEAGFAQETKSYSRLAGSGRTDQQDVVGAAQEVQAGEAVDLRLVDARLALEGEGFERPAPRQMRLIEAVGQTALASR
jgi:hypothetical protein